ncbi:unnamed protein product [Heligmosomoides polygyrus]|uniref:Uncharacterized protein n=1 Tax=Heligmosomoides polygyrus TaxID=6339 RepID=A0A183F6C2_HELPZ|nr:unnamed protein product [Heligmosomoides polygyrus]
MTPGEHGFTAEQVSSTTTSSTAPSATTSKVESNDNAERMTCYAHILAALSETIRRCKESWRAADGDATGGEMETAVAISRMRQPYESL